MKIINPYRNRPRRPYAAPIPENEELQPKKRALLIGIVYKGEKGKTQDLRGPHKDVEAMKELLISKYGYQPKDIVTLLDNDGPASAQPTRLNILNQIDLLVQDARPGDRFFFHYSGHTSQKENKNNSEEDGLDEYIVPCDQEARPIPDNLLRKKLVESLPVGSQLVAVFDSCHSESLLDLEHHRCNRVYVPWISKGKRKSDSIWNKNVRRDGVEFDQSASVSSRKVTQIKRVSDGKIRSRRSTIEQVLSSANANGQILSISTKVQATKSTWADIESPIPRCESPTKIFPCDGMCSRETSGTTEAEVISLSSCKDSQLAWEIADGASMTQVLVKLLATEPNPRYKSLMVNISHLLHDATIKMHQDTRKFKNKQKNYLRKMKKRGRKVESTEVKQLEMDNFQDPQLASHRPLDMNARWNP